MINMSVISASAHNFHKFKDAIWLQSGGEGSNMLRYYQTKFAILLTLHSVAISPTTRDTLLSNLPIYVCSFHFIATGEFSEPSLLLKKEIRCVE